MRGVLQTEGRARKAIGPAQTAQLVVVILEGVVAWREALRPFRRGRRGVVAFSASGSGGSGTTTQFLYFLSNPVEALEGLFPFRFPFAGFPIQSLENPEKIFDFVDPEWTAESY